MFLSSEFEIFKKVTKLNLFQAKSLDFQFV